MKVKELLKELQKANPETTIQVAYEIPKEDPRTGRPKTTVHKNVEYVNILTGIVFPGEETNDMCIIKIEDD